MTTPAHYPLKIYCGQPLTTPFQYAISGVVLQAPATSAAGQMLGWGEADLDQFFIEAQDL